MSSRTRGSRNRASKLPVADKPQSGQKQKPQGSKVRKSKYSPAGPSHGSKAMEQKIARARLLHEWSKGACYYYNPRELRCAPGAKAEEPKIHNCPHLGSDNPFDFIFCKPDCPRIVSDSVLPRRSSALRNIKDDSSSSDPVLSCHSLALGNIKDDSSSSDPVLSDHSSSLSSSEDDSSSSGSDEGMITRPYAPRRKWDPMQHTQRCVGDPPFVVW